MRLDSLSVTDAAENGVPVDLLHPGTGEPIGVVVSVRGYESEAVDAAIKSFHKMALESRRKLTQFEVISGRRKAQAKASIISVEGSGDNEDVTVSDVHALIDKPGFVWVIEQIEAVAGDRASFFTSAEKP